MILCIKYAYYTVHGVLILRNYITYFCQYYGELNRSKLEGVMLV